MLRHSPTTSSLAFVAHLLLDPLSLSREGLLIHLLSTINLPPLPFGSRSLYRADGLHVSVCRWPEQQVKQLPAGPSCGGGAASQGAVNGKGNGEKCNAGLQFGWKGVRPAINLWLHSGRRINPSCSPAELSSGAMNGKENLATRCGGEKPGKSLVLWFSMPLWRSRSGFFAIRPTTNNYHHFLPRQYDHHGCCCCPRSAHLKKVL